MHETKFMHEFHNANARLALYKGVCADYDPRDDFLRENREGAPC
jgi:hypothetical protein